MWCFVWIPGQNKKGQKKTKKEQLFFGVLAKSAGQGKEGSHRSGRGKNMGKRALREKTEKG